MIFFVFKDRYFQAGINKTKLRFFQKSFLQRINRRQRFNCFKMQLNCEFFVFCSGGLSKHIIENILELEEKVGDASAYEPYIRETIADGKFYFYWRFGARIIDKIGVLKYVQLKF